MPADSPPSSSSSLPTAPAASEHLRRLYLRFTRSAATLGILPRMLARLIHALRTLGIWAVALLLLFEEWGWQHLAALLAWIGRLPGLRWIERRIRGLTPYQSLALFAIPVLALLPLKLLALYWLGQGHVLLGLSVILAAKIGGTALTARLFMLTQPTLMRLPWFARLFTRWMAWKTRVLDSLRHSPVWQTARQWVQRVRELLQKTRQRVWHAIRQIIR